MPISNHKISVGSVPAHSFVPNVLVKHGRKPYKSNGFRSHMEAISHIIAAKDIVFIGYFMSNSENTEEKKMANRKLFRVGKERPKMRK